MPPYLLVHNTDHLAAAMLSVRPLSRTELKKKLHETDLTWEVAERTVLDCERLGFVNDPETAEFYVRSMRNRGDGSKKIKMKQFHKIKNPNL